MGNVGEVIILIAVLALFLAIQFVSFAVARHLLPVVPLYIAFAAYTLSLLLQNPAQRGGAS